MLGLLRASTREEDLGDGVTFYIPVNRVKHVEEFWERQPDGGSLKRHKVATVDGDCHIVDALLEPQYVVIPSNEWEALFFDRGSKDRPASYHVVPILGFRVNLMERGTIWNATPIVPGHQRSSN